MREQNPIISITREQALGETERKPRERQIVPLDHLGSKSFCPSVCFFEFYFNLYLAYNYNYLMRQCAFLFLFYETKRYNWLKASILFTSKVKKLKSWGASCSREKCLRCAVGSRKERRQRLGEKRAEMLAYFCLAKFKFGGPLQSLNPSLEVGLSKRKQTRWNIKEKIKTHLSKWDAEKC